MRLQYNTILRTSIAPVSLAWASSRALQAHNHETENMCSEESHIRHQEIGKSTKRCILRRSRKRVRDLEERIHRGSLFRREGAQALKTLDPVTH